MKAILIIGRILFSIIFLFTIIGHFSATTIGYAASQGLPMASVLVPLSGVIACLGAISIIIGFKAKWGAWLLVIFLIPVTFMFHKFWAITDPMQQQMQMAFFMKNISMLGAALMITYFGSRPYSFDDALKPINTK